MWYVLSLSLSLFKVYLLVYSFFTFIALVVVVLSVITGIPDSKWIHVSVLIDKMDKISKDALILELTKLDLDLTTITKFLSLLQVRSMTPTYLFELLLLLQLILSHLVVAIVVVV